MDIRYTPAPALVITRHDSLVAYLREISAIGWDADVIAHATPEAVRGRNVVGVLPLHLAAEAASVTCLDLDLPPDARGRELSLEELRAYARGLTCYVVRRAPISAP